MTGEETQSAELAPCCEAADGNQEHCPNHRRPRLLDLFACEGGATAGYQRAGWHVTAVDLDRNRLNYNPAGPRYVSDALAFLAEFWHKFDAVHLSPPCQWYTRGNAPRRGQEGKWERTIPAARAAVQETGLPYVIENVKDAAWDLREPVTLCGCMFDLSTVDTDGIRIHLQRPRLFETNWGMTAPRPCDHSAHEWVAGAYGGARRDKYEARYVRKGGYVPREKEVVKALLGVEHDMTWNGLFECLPPAYTEHIGQQLLAHVARTKYADRLESMTDDPVLLKRIDRLRETACNRCGSPVPQSPCRWSDVPCEGRMTRSYRPGTGGDES